jgi:hypothetical protein
MSISSKSSTFKLEVPLPTTFLLISLGFWIIDFSATLSNKGKFQYIPLLVILILCVYHYNQGNLQLIDGSQKYIWLSMYFAYGVTGILTGKLYFGAVNGPLPLVLPYALLCFNIIGFYRSISTKNALKFVSTLCLVGNTLVVLTRIKVIQVLDLFQFSHENSYLLPLAIGCAIAAQSKLLVVLNITVCIIMFGVYPAGTYLLTFLLMGVFLFAFSVRRARRLTLISFVILHLIEGFLIYQITFRFDKLLSPSNIVFETLGKADNTLYRKILSDQMLFYFLEKPIFGSGFAGEILILTRFSSIPAHNDYLTLLVAGGIVGLALFLLMILSIQWEAIQKLSQVSEMDCKILSILLCSTNIFLVSMAVNPLGMKTFNSLMFIGCLFWIRSISEGYE